MTLAIIYIHDRVSYNPGNPGNAKGGTCGTRGTSDVNTPTKGGTPLVRPLSL
jgi:hypothetical protein